MNFILINWVKYYTKEAFKTLKVISVGSAIIVTVAYVKYKPAYKVTLMGESIGYVESKESIEEKIDKYLNDTTGNIAFREISAKPEYEFKLINRAEELKEKDIMLAVQDVITTTYKTYAITVDGEQKAFVTSQEEAEKIINEITDGLDSNIDLKLGVLNDFSTELHLNSEEETKNILNEIKTAKVEEYEAAKAEAARIAAAKKAAARKAAEARARAAAEAAAIAENPDGSVQVATAPEVSVASAGPMGFVAPVSGSISSRFGSRSSVRSSAHTGLDIACSSGTGIRPAAAGTVTFAAYNGSYGNLIKIDHGNGYETWYAHCSAIYVSPGQYVDTGSVIGAVGQTGNATGPHLHLEIRIGGSPVNPQNYLY